MVAASDSSVEVDLHRLQLRFSDTRLTDRRAIDNLAQSIERCGQLLPCIAVPGGGAEVPLVDLVLIDGYRRVAALKRLGRDTARIDVWQCDLAEGLLQTLVRAQARRFDPIEEALLLRELVHGLGLSQNEVARRSARDVSWVNRRLALLTSLPQECLQAVCQGSLSCWAATRVLGPLARANASHAGALLRATTREELSTRDLAQWYSHYQRSTRAVRERMAAEPALFLQSLQAREQERAIDELSAGPEGQCVKDLRHLDAVVGRVRERLLMLSKQELSGELVEILQRVRASLVRWCQEIGRYDDQARDPQCGADVEPPEQGRASHRTRAEHLTEHGSEYTEEADRKVTTGNENSTIRATGSAS